tara:strand:- start:9414 stop:10628 length:1215 start_codon:yes stop_codon:yes gene_type:complete
LICAAQCGAPTFNPNVEQHLCVCGSPLFAEYDLETLSHTWQKKSLAGRISSLWRYREVLPIDEKQEPVSLGEGFTPLLRSPHLERELDIRTIHVKDESINPTNSFKARGLSVAVTRARDLGARILSVPSAGNAANALAAYAAQAGLLAEVFLPSDIKKPFIKECELYGANITLVDGVITDAGREAARLCSENDWYDVSTLKEPYRLEGKKTLAYEVAEQLHWTLPDWMIYPTGGGTGIVGMWKALSELKNLGWLPKGLSPKFVSVQAENCAPIVKAFHSKKTIAPSWPNARTIADGLRVPKGIGDFLILKVLRESNGTAVAVSDEEMISGMLELGVREGISAAPEGGATLAALKSLRSQNMIKKDDHVVLFNTGGALKYLELLSVYPDRLTNKTGRTSLIKSPE